MATDIVDRATAAPATDLLTLMRDTARFLQHFMSGPQLRVMGAMLAGEEGEWFQDKLVEMATLIRNMPKTYEQDGKGDEAIAYLHYFKGGCDWYITEKDAGDKDDAEQGIQTQAFGLADLGSGPETGYIDVDTLIQHNVELDLHFTPTPIGEIRAMLEKRNATPAPGPAPGMG